MFRIFIFFLFIAFYALHNVRAGPAVSDCAQLAAFRLPEGLVADEVGMLVERPDPDLKFVDPKATVFRMGSLYSGEGKVFRVVAPDGASYLTKIFLDEYLFKFHFRIFKELEAVLTKDRESGFVKSGLNIPVVQQVPGQPRAIWYADFKGVPLEKIFESGDISKAHKDKIKELYIKKCHTLALELKKKFPRSFELSFGKESATTLTLGAHQSLDYFRSLFPDNVANGPRFTFDPGSGRRVSFDIDPKNVIVNPKTLEMYYADFF